jgi:hypothetical protein
MFATTAPIKVNSSLPMSSLQYLTVQDLLWINLQIAKKVNTFRYATLEEATFYQYSLGDSREIATQAARFLNGYIKLAPISELNEATGFVGCLAFLKLNGYEVVLKDSEGAKWVDDVRSLGVSAVDEKIRKDPHAHHDANPKVRAAVHEVLQKFPKTVSALNKLTTA